MPMKCSEEKIRVAHRKIRRWYEKHGRHSLPWRHSDDPYTIWVSEIMLQQTQVITVKERYFQPFLTQFPTVQALADAPLEMVLKAWEGLGYYSRARNLHKAAQLTAPALPETVEELLALPGIGRNTAHAIAAFAYRLPVPVMEANVRRILHRLAAEKTLSDKALWMLADRLLDRGDPFAFNQAMMDIGALLCTPKTPECPACPLNTLCEGKAHPEAYPARTPRKATPVRRRVIVVPVNMRGEYSLSPRSTELLGGLYGFPELPAAAPLPGSARKLGAIRQTYSHFRLEAEVYLLEPEETTTNAGWFNRAQINALPLSGADRKVLALLEEGEK